MPTSSLKLIQAFIYGLTPIIIPIVFHTREVNEIFKLLLFDDNNEIALQIKHFFLVWLLGLIVFFVKYPESSQRQVLEIIALASLLVTTPPLWGFAFYFCFVHSIRHFLNLRKELNNLERFDVIALFMTSVATIALVALAGFLLEGNGMEESLLKVTFIGLAALTVPHMLLVDLYPRIRNTSF
jgi:Brp/Blh family beta-carotene 15,15'-monooxygenase